MQSICKHCGDVINHYDGRLWHSKSPIFPQYCRSQYDKDGKLMDAQLHAPKQEVAPWADEDTNPVHLGSTSGYYD